MVRPIGENQQRSLIVQHGLDKTGDEKPTPQLGDTLTRRAERIYVQTQYVRTLMGNAHDNPWRFGTSVVAVLAGASQLYSGNYVWGGIEAGLGVKELISQCTTGPSDSLQKLLSDIGADVGMIQTLEEGQQKSYQIVEDNLKFIGNELNTLFSKLAQIKELDARNLSEIQVQKNEALQKGLKAKLAFSEVLQLFEDCKKSFEASKTTYGKCQQHFIAIQKLAKDDSPEIPLSEKLNTMVITARQAQQDCQLGKQELDIAEKLFSTALTKLHEAVSLKDEAIEMVTQAVQKAEDTLKAGVEIAAHTKKCEETVQDTQRKLVEVKECSDDIMRLLKEMLLEVKRAKNEAAKKLDPSDVAVGIATAMALTNPLGYIYAFTTGMVTTYAWHNGTTISDVSKRIYSFVFKTPQTPVTPMAEHELIRASMSPISTGYWGWAKGYGSGTAGVLEVNLGKNEVLQLPYNLDDSEYPICKEVLCTFFNTLMEKINDKSLDPKRCKDILQEMETMKISRVPKVPEGVQIASERIKPPINGVIRQTQGAWGLVKSVKKLCGQLQTVS